ncbi:MAG: DUF2256 domain-containing protein [Halieaceae bacterium]|nr:DUF2256 domain-containing protein [Halieaceae bacterium]
MMAQRKKSDLPSKICPVCDRPFSWRARWKNQWDDIVYCSKRCSGQRWRLKRADPDNKA